ncbi:PEP-CTERM sorting domain-containing protein [Microcystis aeruginosa]|uniref:PEP-CTERM sorting domain-containing protein n=1 Tax=Microcystis aeruginosa TaxID=1126 RepID=UPI002330807E|nr:PEP-CTERM sorting domain-containing protein [Microcystis aeruginosa]MDB9391882.1 PEP-CTERM sorting domain-containing protein [Microcystis aeruginosa CS-579]
MIFGGGVKPSLLIAGAILTASIPFQSAQAASFKTTFTFSGGESPSSSGTAYFTVNDSAISAIGPNGFGDILPDVTAFTATFTGLSTSPTTTTFSLADLGELFIQTDASTNVNSAVYVTIVNADGYQTFSFGFGLQFLFSPTGNSTVYASNTSQVPVPEPSAVLSLLALGGLGLVSLKRKQN